MKYKSELIKEIVETRGHHLSSPHYESECVESWIEETKGAYPKLCDYESEWLNYINENHSGDSDGFSYETVSVVKEATVDNVAPYEYKSAIIKGNTLVNVLDIKASSTYLASKELTGFSFDAVEAPNEQMINTKGNYKKGSDYTLLFKSDHAFKLQIGYDMTNTEWKLYDIKIGRNIIKVATLSDTSCDYIRLRTDSNNINHEKVILSNFIVIEGDYSLYSMDIPYFEGMQSVQMPVLTTSNEDGTKTNSLTVNEDIVLRRNGEVYDELNLLTGRLTQRIDENNEVLSQEVVKTVALTPLNKPYEGTNHYHLTANIPCEAILEVPVVSTEKQTIEEINN